MARKALITGITGQDGSYLAEQLLDKGYEVFGLVRRLSSPNTRHIFHLLERIRLIDGDLLDAVSLDEIIAHRSALLGDYQNEGLAERYRVPLVPNARCFKAGHRLRLYLTSDDQGAEKPALLMFRHASVGTSSLNTVLSSSRLLLPALAASAALQDKAA